MCENVRYTDLAAQTSLDEEREAREAQETRRTDNDEATREQLLMLRAQHGVHDALTTAQATSAGGPLHFGLRPSSAALRQAVSAPMLPPCHGLLVLRLQAARATAAR